MALDEASKQYFRQHPEAFSAYYFPKKFSKGELKDKPSPLQLFHVELLRMPVDYKKYFCVTINEPNGHGKTTIIDHDLVVWGLCMDPDIRIAIITDKQKTSESIIRDIIDTLVSNEELIEDWGPFIPDTKKKSKWGVDGFSVAKRNRKGKDHTVTAMGWDGMRPGFRADWIIIDDVVNPDNAASVEQKTKMMRDFDEVTGKRGEGFGMQVFVVGTKFEWGDMYHILEERSKKSPRRYKYIRVDAVQDDVSCQDWLEGVCPHVDEKGRHITHSLWPELYPLDKLMEEREDDPIAFDKCRRNIVYPRENLAFPQDKVEMCCDTSRSIGHAEPNWIRILSWDPAQSSGRSVTGRNKTKAARGALMVFAFDPENPGKDYLVDMWSGQESVPSQRYRGIQFYEKYDCLEWVIENNAMQGGIKQELDEFLYLNGYNFRTTPHFTSKHNKIDPEIGLQNLPPIVINSNLSIPYGDSFSKILVAPFVEELLKYPAYMYKDLIMAWWFYTLRKKTCMKRREARFIDNPYSPYETNQKWVKNPAYA